MSDPWFFAMMTAYVVGSICAFEFMAWRVGAWPFDKKEKSECRACLYDDENRFSHSCARGAVGVGGIAVMRRPESDQEASQ